MSFFENPQKAKVVFIITLVLLIVFFLSAGVAGYFYYQKNLNYNDLDSKYSKLKREQTDAKKLQKQITTLNQQIADLQKQIETKNASSTTIKAYNDFFKYMNSIIRIHNGYTGWTDAEYQVGRQKAQATGSSSFVSLVDWAWNRTDIDPNTRVLGVLDAIAKGIGDSL